MSKFEDFGIGDGDVNKIEKNPDQLLSAEEDAIVLNEPDNSFKMLGKKSKYNPKSEYHADLESESVKESVENAKRIYKEFEEEFLHKLDFSDPESIVLAYEEAERRGIFKKAEEIRSLLFGKDMHFYGVVYTSDKCANNCAYCPAALKNKEKTQAEGIVYPQKALTLEQIARETNAVMDDGHTHICYLEGSPSKERIDNNSYARKIARYVSGIIKETKDRGLEEIILNIEPLTEDGFRIVAEAAKEANEEAGANVALQFRVFQETYNEEVYAESHLQNESGNAPKADYWNRRNSQARALRAGFDSIGLGALYGLNKYPLEEVRGLLEHIQELRREFPDKPPARVCFPSANELQNLNTEIQFVLKTGQTRPKKEGETLGEFKYGDYEKANRLLYALARLAMPEINIVSSERDTPEMLEELDKYATCTTLGVKPGVGGNSGIPLDRMASKRDIEAYDKAKEEGKITTFSQSTVFPRNPKETIISMKESGYNPIINLGAKNLQ